MYGAVAVGMIGGAGRGPIGRRGDDVALRPSPLFHVSGCHSTLVVGTAGRLEAGDPDRAASTPERRSADPGASKVTIWATVPTMVRRVLRAPDRHDVRHVDGAVVAFGGSPVGRDEPQRMIRETFPNVTEHQRTRTDSPRRTAVATVIGGPGRHRQAHLGRAAACRSSTVRIRTTRTASEVGSRPSTGEVLITGPDPHGRATGTSPRPPPRPCATAGSTPATSATATPRASSSSSTAEGHDHPRRRERLLHRDRARARGPSRDRRGRGHRRPRYRARRAREGDRAARGRARPSTSRPCSSGSPTGLAAFKVPDVDFTDKPLPRNPAGKLLKNVLRGEGDVSFVETM